MLHLTFPAKHFSGKYVTTKHFDLFFHMFQRLSVYPLFCLKHKYERLRDDRHKVVECHCSTAPLPPHIALGKSWGKLADGWTVGLAEISWSSPPAPFAGPAHQLTSDYLGFEKNTHGQLLSLLLQLLQLQVNVSASDSHFLGPGLPQLGWKRGKQWFLGQRCPTMLRLLSHSFNLKTSALLCSVSPPSWLHFYYCVIINTFISLCFLWNGEAPSTKSKEIYSHTKRLFFFPAQSHEGKIRRIHFFLNMNQINIYSKRKFRLSYEWTYFVLLPWRDEGCTEQSGNRCRQLGCFPACLSIVCQC